MAEEIDPKLLAEELMEGVGANSGLKPFCIRGKQCERRLTCEHLHPRNQSVNVLDLYRGRGVSGLVDCASWEPRKELNSQGDVPRRKPGSGSKHNPHAPDRTAAREALGYKNIPDLTKGTGSLKDAFAPNNGGRLILPPHLQTPPDLNVTRHIRDGQNIKDEGED